MSEKINLSAIMTKEGKLYVVDQDGREFNVTYDSFRAIGDDENAVQTQLEIEFPYTPTHKAYVNVSFRVPLKVESESLRKQFVEFWVGR